jgi:hypothetical protein
LEKDEWIDEMIIGGAKSYAYKTNKGKIEMRLKGFWGWLWGWSEIGATFDTEQEARQRVTEYKRAEGPRFGKTDTTFRYIYID